MLFNSFTFVIFFALVLTAYWLLRDVRDRQKLLFVSSLIFYGSWNPPFLLLLLLSVAVDFWAALAMERWPARKRSFLILSIASNLGILGFFKYADFLMENVVWALGKLGLAAPAWEPLGFILPLGISFYTFQTMSYSLDVYRGRQKAVHSIVVFGTYVSFFPQLVAGPIVRARELIPQLQKPQTLTEEDVFVGVNRMLLGFFKKILLADWLALFVDSIFSNPTLFSPMDRMLATYAFSLQLYLDFSAYSDIAIGAARLFGYRLPENFLRPYQATSFTAFWQNWHLTLTRWLRDYLFSPLRGVGKARSRMRSALALTATMLAVGLWHGAAWNFVLWGIFHGAGLLAHQLIIRSFGERKPGSRVSHVLCVMLMFHIHALGAVLFRSPDLGTIAMFWETFFSVWTFQHGWGIFAGVMLGSLLLQGLALTLEEVQARLAPRFPQDSRTIWLYGAGVAAMLLGMIAFAAPTSEYIYFVF